MYCYSSHYYLCAHPKTNTYVRSAGSLGSPNNYMKINIVSMILISPLLGVLATRALIGALKLNTENRDVRDAIPMLVIILSMAILGLLILVVDSI